MTGQLLKRLLPVAIVAIAVLTFAGQVSADVALTNTDLNANSLGIGPPLPGVTTIDVSPLRFYTNTFAGAGTAGADVRDVFAGVLSSAHDGVSYTPINGPGGATTFINILGAVEGTANQTGTGASTLTISSGGFELIASAKPLNTADPSTWTGATFATFKIGPATGVFPGSPNPSESAQITVSGAVMNQSTVNTADPTQNQGRLLFVNGPGASSFLLPGDPSAPQPPSGVFAHFGQLIETTVTAATSGLTPADLTLMNAIQTMFTGDLWATGIGAGPQSNWDPLSPTASGFPTDFRATGEGAELNPFGPIPEPSSIVLLGMGFGGFALRMFRRKRKVLS